MEVNKDESERCIAIALRHLSDGKTEKALKFLLKAQKLYPSQRAEELISRVNSMNGAAPQANDSSPGEGEGMRQRRHSASRTGAGKAGGEEETHVEYSQEQMESVLRIKKCKDYYEILGVTKEATENDLKKAYRKLALQMHPDKNKAPGATEAFKAIGNAFAVLNDSEKRRKYDLYGPDTDTTSRDHRHDDYTHGGFEGDISPEELFNMFFGGAFPTSRTTRYHQRHHRHGTHYYYHREPTQQSESGYTMILQLAPILILILLSLLSSLFVSDPVFSMQRNSKYTTERTTQNLRIPYYVKPDFHPEYKGELRRIERSVEEEFISQMRSQCWRERAEKENMMWRARNFGDAKLYQRAQEKPTPSCDRLQQIYS